MRSLLLCITLLFAPVLAWAQQADELQKAYDQLKAAEAKKDPDELKKWALATSEAARKLAASPAPASEAEKQSWQQRVDWAKQVDTYTEYAMYALALQPGNPAKTVELVEAVEGLNPKSQYLGQLFGPYVYALSQIGQAPKILAAAERRVAHDPANEDILLILADGSMSAKQPEKALEYARKLTEVMQAKAKPEGMADADWEKKKKSALGRGYWIAGVVQADQKAYADADKSLRAALEHIGTDAAMLGPAAFYLGVANYNLGKTAKNKALMQEGIKFSDQSAGIAGPYQALAKKNAASMRTEVLAMPKK